MQSSSQEISDAASAEYQVELAADAMEEETQPHFFWRVVSRGEQEIFSRMPWVLA